MQISRFDNLAEQEKKTGGRGTKKMEKMSFRFVALSGQKLSLAPPAPQLKRRQKGGKKGGGRKISEVVAQNSLYQVASSGCIVHVHHHHHHHHPSQTQSQTQLQPQQGQRSNGRGNKSSTSSDMILLGILAVHEHHHQHQASLTNSVTSSAVGSQDCVVIRQIPLFSRNSIAGIFVPFDQDVTQFAGVELYGSSIEIATATPTTSKMGTSKSKSSVSIDVRLHSFNRSTINTANLDLIRNICSNSISVFGATSDSSGNNNTANVIAEEDGEDEESFQFFLSNICVAPYRSLRDHFVGFVTFDPVGEVAPFVDEYEIENNQIKTGLAIKNSSSSSSNSSGTDCQSLLPSWPIFLDRGYLCLKLDSLKTLLRRFPLWIDARYRIRLGHNPQTWAQSQQPPQQQAVQQQATIRFTALPVILPQSFEYPSTIDPELMTMSNNKMPVDKSKIPVEFRKIARQSSESFTNEDEKLQAPRKLPNGNNSIFSTNHNDNDNGNKMAGVCFVRRASTALNSVGQIPHNFPVIESNPPIRPIIDRWLPPYVHRAIENANKFYERICSSGAVGGKH